MKPITSQSRLTFGAHKGVKLRDCPASYLEWLAANLRDGDFRDWAEAAGTELAARKTELGQGLDLEKQADEFLRNRGYDPRRL